VTVDPPPHRPGPVTRRLLRLPGRLYDWHLGWLLGHRFLRLTHVGRRSGRRYQTMLEVLGEDPSTGEVLVLASLGTRTDWYRNLRDHPAVEVALGRSRFRPAHRVLDPDEAVAAITAFERRNRLVMPVVRRVLGWLAGWPYDSSPEARRRLAEQLPIVALRPED
jgi:deazaflavin-dependent oxidoreductase (nitroreductase family)